MEDDYIRKLIAQQQRELEVGWSTSLRLVVSTESTPLRTLTPPSVCLAVKALAPYLANGSTALVPPSLRHTEGPEEKTESPPPPPALNQVGCS